MKLFNTMPPFERLKKEMEANKAWKYLSIHKQDIIKDFTRKLCDRGRPPSRVVLYLLDTTGRLNGGAAWWFGRFGYMERKPDGRARFTTFRRPWFGGRGQIGESFTAVDLEHGMAGFFSRLDRIRKEEECAS